ncbi:MAG: hypothetical protein AAFU67_12475 [Bacteroidota bacterium]
MILIPQRLFADPQVSILLRQENTCILRKELTQPLIQREAYVANHVISFVLAGEQKLKTYDEHLISVKEGEIVFLPRGVYYVTDLLPAQGHFKSVLFYFDDELIHSFLRHSKVTEIHQRKAPDHLKFEQLPKVRLFVESLLAIYGEQKGTLQIAYLELAH